MDEWGGWLPEKKEYPVPPEGLYPAVCVDVSEAFLEDGEWGKKWKFYIYWQLDLLEPDSKRRFVVRRKFGKSLHPKSKFRPFLEAWRGKHFDSDDEARKFDSERLVGANCQLQIAHFIKNNGGVGYDVQAIVPARPTDPKLHPQDYVRAKDKPKEQHTAETHSTEPF